MPVRGVIFLRHAAKRRFETMARQLFIRFKALLMEPGALAYAGRHDSIETISDQSIEDLIVLRTSSHCSSLAVCCCGR
jgi:hypothetical protein